jgi:UDP-N-acetylmuramoyl-tripeptide--D-alanyl-D-alanine ligase
MTLLSILTFIFFSVWLFRNILYWLFLWQVKEYRFDRILVHLKETNQGKELYTKFDGTAKIILILLYLFAFSLFDSNLLQILFSLLFSVYFYNFLFTLKEIYTHRLRKPVFTIKIITIIFCVAIVLFIVLITGPQQIYMLPVADKLATFLTALFIGIFSLPSRIYYSFIIHSAANKLRTYSNLKIIGITGCIGKGSTKEYMSTILGEKFKILKTFETQNTPIGIAQTILHKLDKNIELFLVEIGAYKIGETNEICRLVKPDIGIITPVEDQHLSLFGNIDNLKTATFELIQNLPEKKGLALFDGNSIPTKELYEKAADLHIEKILCFTQHNSSGKLASDIYAKNIFVEKFLVSFNVFIKSKKIGSFSVRLLGSHHVENILPGIFLANTFGMTAIQIKKGVSKIRPWKKTMEPYLADNQAVLIDDTYNASPGATIAACQYMKIYKGKKIMVLQPFIELGENAIYEHKRVGKIIRETCDHLFLTNDNFHEDICKGVKSAHTRCTIQIAQPDEIVSYVKNNLRKEDIVVFEGKEAGVSLLRMRRKKIFV